MTIQKLKKKNPESSQLFLPTTSWAYITTSVTSDPIRASQRVFLFPLLPLLPSNFSMAATVSFKHTTRFCYSASQWLLITFIMKPECPPMSSQAYIICSHILHLMLDSVLLAPSTAPHGLSDDSLSLCCFDHSFPPKPGLGCLAPPLLLSSSGISTERLSPAPI